MDFWLKSMDFVLNKDDLCTKTGSETELFCRTYSGQCISITRHSSICRCFWVYFVTDLFLGAGKDGVLRTFDADVASFLNKELVHDGISRLYRK